MGWLGDLISTASSFIPGFGPVISAGANIVGGLIGKSGQKSANNANIAIAREQNSLNYRMFREQNDFNIAQWNAQNAYNTPLAQRQRYEQAGINPYLALGNIQSGQAQGLTSAVAQPAVGAQMQNENAYLANGIAGAGNAMSNIAQSFQNFQMNNANIDSVKAQTEATRVQTALERLKLPWQSRLLEHGLELTIAQKNFIKEQTDNLKEIRPHEVNRLIAQANNLNADRYLKDIQRQSVDYDLKELKPLQKKRLIGLIAETCAKIDLAHSQIRLNKSLGVMYGAQAILAKAQAMGINISNHVQGFIANQLMHRNMSDPNALKAIFPQFDYDPDSPLGVRIKNESRRDSNNTLISNDDRAFSFWTHLFGAVGNAGDAGATLLKFFFK